MRAPLAAAAILGLLALGSPAQAAPAAVGIWGAAPEVGPAVDDANCPASAGSFTGGTIRDIVHPARAGDTIRVRISNQWGTGPLVVDAATVGLQSTGAGVAAGSLHRLSFGGKAAVTVAAGTEATSDWTAFPITAQRNLAISVHVTAAHGPMTYHRVAKQQNYFSRGPADQTGQLTGLTGQQTNQCWMFVTGVDEQAPATVAGTVVTFGDSITDGQNSTNNANARWPDVLAARLAARQGTTMSVVNEGIGGNRLLTHGPTSPDVLSGLSRFPADALGRPGVKTVILLEGVNDIGAAALGRTPPITAQSLIDGYQKIIAQAHAKQVRVIGATITPFQGAAYWTAAGEQIREQVNQWILTSGAFDGTADFAQAVADPQNPQHLAPRFDIGGGHLHPNDAGYAAMAGAIDLAALIPPGATP